MERRLEWPLLAAALLTIPATVIEQSSVGEPWDTTATVLNWTIWTAFVIEVGPMLSVVDDRGRWLRDHPLDVAIGVLTHRRSCRPACKPLASSGYSASCAW
jgi:hypothetical protein